MFSETVCEQIGDKMSSVTKNSILNAIKSFSNLILPLITFSYTSRIIGSEGLGKVDFAKSYVNYFSILAMLGIINYATREAAKLRDNKKELSKFAHEILFINLCSLCVSYILFGVSLYFINKLKDYYVLLIVFSATIFLNVLGMEWLYMAEEDYGYITKRTIAFQVISLILTIFMVRDSNGIYSYAIIQVISSSGSYILNFIHSKKYISFAPARNYNCKKHIKSILKLFFMTVFVQIFTHLDMTMLGFLKNDYAVGLYSVAHKLSSVLSGVMIAITAVITPRIAYYNSCNNKKRVENITYAAFNYLMMISLPACVGLFLLSPQIVLCFSGSKFMDAILTAKIMAFRVVLVPLNTFFIVHYSIPLGKENRTIFTVAVAAVCNFVLNMIVISVYSQNGAAVSTVIAESIELILNMLLVSGEIKFIKTVKETAQYLIGSMLIIVIWTQLKLYLSDYVQMMVYILSSVFVYFAFLLCVKNQYVWNLVDKMKRKTLNEKNKFQ